MPTKHTDNHWRGGILLLLLSVLFEGWEMALNIMASVKAASLEPSSGSLTITVFVCLFKGRLHSQGDTSDKLHKARQPVEEEDAVKGTKTQLPIIALCMTFQCSRCLKNWLVDCQGVCKVFVRNICICWVFLSGEGIRYFSSSLKNNNSALCQTESILGQPQCHTLVLHLTNVISI